MRLAGDTEVIAAGLTSRCCFAGRPVMAWIDTAWAID